MDLLPFIAVSAALIAIPGPNVLVIVATSLMHGKVRGLQTVAGTSTAMLVQLLVAALGTAWLVAAISDGLVWLKWAGVVYLAVLGLTSFRHAMREVAPALPDPGQTFATGFLVSLTNPKTIVFFGAFLPQFVAPGEPYFPQIAVLSAIFWLLAVILDSAYALMADRLGARFRALRTPRTRNLLSGIVYLGAGAALSLARIER